MKIKHFMYLLALVLMINLNACSSDSPEEEIPEVPPQEEPGTDPNAPQARTSWSAQTLFCLKTDWTSM